MAIHGFGSTAMGDPLDHFWGRSNIFTASSLWVASTKLNEMAFLALASKVEGEKKRNSTCPHLLVFFSSGKKRGLTGLLLCGFFPPNSFSYRCSYFLGGEGSQNLWIRCEGGCHTGSRWRCRLVCVGVRVRRSKTGLSSHRVSLEV